MSKFFNGVAKVGAWSAKAVAVGVGAATTAMTALTTKALNMGGELEQNMGGSEAVFKECAEGMQNSAKEAFSNMGLSASDFLATANKMGSLFQGAGFSIEESASLSTEAMQRAADVASIMGISTESAMEAIAGAAKGNFTMMDNLGVAMNDTTLQAYALSKGIETSTSEMTNQEKIGLAMEMFMEKTSYAAGNYAKENETLAGSLGTAKAALSNFLSGAGDVESVVTAFSSAANVIVKNINDLLPRLVNGITDLVNQIVPLIPPLLQSLLPGIIDGAVSLINGLVAALPMVLDALMLALPGLITGLEQIVTGLIAALRIMIGENLIATFQKFTTTNKNAIGENVREWSDVIQKKGFLDYVNGGAEYEYNTKLQESTHLLICDYFDFNALGITSENARIIIEGQIYSVQIIDDPMGRNQHLEVYLKYTGGQLTTQ